MAKVTVVNDGMNFLIQTTLERKFTVDALADAINLAKEEIAKKLWELHKDEIMSKMNLEGLANLIAVYAARDFKPK